MTIYIFTGPTITASDVREILPEADVRPPIQHGDLYKLDLGPEDVVGIIDGLFFQNVCVRHQEIIQALQVGARVAGAGSMGAIRAAELRFEGMEGFGTFYRCLTLGLLDGDDEVTVSHSSNTEGYLATSEALINMRCTFHAMKRAGIIGEVETAGLIASAKQRVFYDRNVGLLLAESDHDAEDQKRLRENFVSHYRNVKRNDALMLLRVLASSDSSTSPDPTVSEMVGGRTVYAVEWHAESLKDDRGESIDDLLSVAQAAAIDYPEFHFRANVALMAALHRGLQIRPFRPQDHTVERYDEILGLIAGQPLSLNSSMLGDAFDMIAASGAYPSSAIAGGPFGDSHPSVEATLRTASVNLAVAPGFQWRHLELCYLLREPGAAALRDVLHRAKEFNIEILGTNPRFRHTRISSAKLRDWFTAFWEKQSSVQNILPLQARGYRGQLDLHKRFSPFYPLMRSGGIEPFLLSFDNEHCNQITYRKDADDLVAP